MCHQRALTIGDVIDFAGHGHNCPAFTCKPLRCRKCRGGGIGGINTAAARALPRQCHNLRSVTANGGRTQKQQIATKIAAQPQCADGNRVKRPGGIVVIGTLNRGPHSLRAQLG